MGFPQWTLWGMGLSIFGALLALGYALYMLSPSRQLSYQIEPYLRDSRLRMATTVAFALLLLTVGFYVAGVPIGEQPIEAAVPVQDAAVSEVLTVADLEAANSAETSQAAPSASGAFAAPLPQDDAAVESAVVDEGGDSAETPADSQADAEPTSTPEPDATATPVPTPTNTPLPTATPTQTPTPLPTATPTPTLTPTPIVGDTAQVATGGSTLWVKRSPGGQNLVILRDGETVILQPGNANQAGLLWKEVMTVQGVSGWVQSEFLDFGNGIDEAAQDS